MVGVWSMRADACVWVYRFRRALRDEVIGGGGERTERLIRRFFAASGMGLRMLWGSERGLKASKCYVNSRGSGFSGMRAVITGFSVE